jgi:uncharacterized protein
VSNSKRDFIIPFVGLKTGVHEFEFEIENTFFEELEYSVIQKGEVLVNLSLEKKETMLIGDFSLKGSVTVPCDRCNDPIAVKIYGAFKLVYKFDDTPSDDEALITIYPEEFEIDVRNNIYEFITVSLPKRCVHEKGMCNEDMIELLNEYTINSDEEEDIDLDQHDNDQDDNDEDNDIDPRWEKLKKLK